MSPFKNIGRSAIANHDSRTTTTVRYPKTLVGRASKGAVLNIQRIGRPPVVAAAVGVVVHLEWDMDVVERAMVHHAANPITRRKYKSASNRAVKRAMVS